MLFAVTRQAIRVAPAYTRTAATATPARRAWSPASATAKKAAATPAAAAAAPAPSSSKVGSSTAATSSPPWEEGTDGLEAGVDDSLLPPSSQPIPSPSTSTTSTTSSAALPSAHTAFPSTPLTEASYAAPIPAPSVERDIDWSTSFHGISSQPFSEKAAALLMRPLVPAEIEIKPDGLLYLPEILYRRILNQAFGPGGWGMVPRGEMTVLKGMVSREWGLVAGGRLVSVARGEQTYFDPSGLPTATEGCKSNALMRCCKDLGIASELWDPGFIRQFKAAHCVEAWTEHGSTKKKQKRWRKKGNKFEYPLKEAA